ncbi:MAG: protein kinase [Leptolyngbyaceae cyanobacterium SM1_3_5]|nr:protein kinase [Leptolyngbyaceae cyanobacterium SM1_3_5]
MDRTKTNSIAHCFNPACPPCQPLTDSHCQRCGASLQLRGYRAIAQLGQNQFSRTLLAIDSTLSECVIQQSWGEPTQAKLSQALQALHHAQIPALIECFEQDGVFYQVQDYVRGESLAKAIADRTFTQAEVWQILESLLPVLHHLHTHDLIHGDIKPENLIQRDRSIVLVDFKSACLSGDRSGKPSGNPEYAAPEQIKGKAVFASDLYSLGVACIHLLTGISPFQLVDGEWHCYWRDADPANRLAQILDRLIAPLSNRFASAAEAIAAIERLRGKKIALPPVESPAIGRNTATFSGHDGLFASVTAVAIASDNLHIASGSEDKTVRLWSVETGETIAVLKGHSQLCRRSLFTRTSPNY